MELLPLYVRTGVANMNYKLRDGSGGRDFRSSVVRGYGPNRRSPFFILGASFGMA